MTALEANANPTKRLFISLITRDISLSDAFLDLIDNSINSAAEALRLHKKTAPEFFAFLQGPGSSTRHVVRVDVSPNAILVVDDCDGIPLAAAKDRVFRFGREEYGEQDSDVLSVYGIGLKRALFKMGGSFAIQSRTTSGGFAMDVNVTEWAKDSTPPWHFEMTELVADQKAKTGTSIRITNLNKEVRSLVSDNQFINELYVKISRAYCYYLGRVVDVSLNGRLVAPITLNLAAGDETEAGVSSFGHNDVDVFVAAGLGLSSRDYAAENAGWFVFCNGRNVLFADKSDVTGWGTPLLPQFQPKHRPFVGLVFFQAQDPERLPWTTTKANINAEAEIWRTALREMEKAARPVIRFLDRRYDKASSADSGPKPAELLPSSARATPAIDIASQGPKPFRAPKTPVEQYVSVQYRVEKKKMDQIRRHLGDSSMSAGKVGQYTFEFFLENEVDQ